VVKPVVIPVGFCLLHPGDASGQNVTYGARECEGQMAERSAGSAE
jgi:hypothetical protein